MSEQAAAAEYRKIKLLEELREELKTEFRKQAALRNERVELEKRLEKLVDRIKKKDNVEKILNKKEYQGIAVRTHRAWLRDIEEEVAASYRDTVRKQMKTVASKEGRQTSVKRETTAQKHQRLLDVLTASKKDTMTQKELALALGFPEKKTGTIGTWLKPLNLPAGAIVDVQKGNPKLGKTVHIAKILNTSSK